MYTRYIISITIDNSELYYTIEPRAIPAHSVKYILCGCGVVYPEPIYFQNNIVKAEIFIRGIRSGQESSEGVPPICERTFDTLKNWTQM